MGYLTYEEYLGYGGSLENIAFDRIEYRAEKIIDNATFGRLKKETVISEAVKRLTFELIGVINNTDYSGEGYMPAVTQEENDGYSVSFASGAVMTIDQTRYQAKKLIEEYLSEEVDSKGTPLLYCGY